tara:strand:- start:563 stop:940 length:378 start_codon:yes stop_codon:yes gene_type:complete
MFFQDSLRKTKVSTVEEITWYNDCMKELSKGKHKGTENLIPYKKGQSGNPNGRPVGSISALVRLKKEFRENPEKFDEYMERYIKNPANEKHVMEMIDGKPMQQTDITSGGQPINISFDSSFNGTP